MENATTIKLELLQYAEDHQVTTLQGDVLCAYLALATLRVGKKRVRCC